MMFPIIEDKGCFSAILFEGDEKRDVAIPYGLLSCCIANTDFDTVQKRLAEKLEQRHIKAEINYLRQRIQPGKERESVGDAVRERLAPAFADMLNAQSFFHPYVSSEMRRFIYLFLLDEVSRRITDYALSEDGGMYRCLPDVYTDRELHQYVIAVLLREPSAFKNPVQNFLTENAASLQTAAMTEDGMPLDFCIPVNLTDFLALDIKHYLKSKLKMNRCQYCKRLFPPKRSSQKYCHMPHGFALKSCADSAHGKPDDVFSKAAKDARGRQHSLTDSAKKKYGDIFPQQLYDEWALECTEKSLYYRKQNDIDGFKAWIGQTRLTASVMAEKYRQLHDSDSEA